MNVCANNDWKTHLPSKGAKRRKKTEQEEKRSNHKGIGYTRHVFSKHRDGCYSDPRADVGVFAVDKVQC